MAQDVQIAVPVCARDTAEALEKMERAAALAQVLEVRLDTMEEFDLHKILTGAPRPVIVTYRSKKEGGNGRAHYATRIRVLREAIEKGADFVDVEFSMPLIYREPLFRNTKRTRVIVSRHILNGTPSRQALAILLGKMAATGADIVKIVSRAKELEDNRRVLELLPLARRLGIPLITFCLGSWGRVSRILSPLLGGFATFASLEEGEESAEGQLPARDMKELLSRLTGHES
jgi:3-dehydroquinate dehydratase type I